MRKLHNCRLRYLSILFACGCLTCLCFSCGSDGETVDFELLVENQRMEPRLVVVDGVDEAEYDIQANTKFTLRDISDEAEQWQSRQWIVDGKRSLQNPAVKNLYLLFNGRQEIQLCLVDKEGEALCQSKYVNVTGGRDPEESTSVEPPLVANDPEEDVDESVEEPEQEVRSAAIAPPDRSSGIVYQDEPTLNPSDPGKPGRTGSTTPGSATSPPVVRTTDNPVAARRVVSEPDPEPDRAPVPKPAPVATPVTQPVSAPVSVVTKPTPTPAAATKPRPSPSPVTATPPAVDPKPIANQEDKPAAPPNPTPAPVSPTPKPAPVTKPSPPPAPKPAPAPTPAPDPPSPAPAPAPTPETATSPKLVVEETPLPPPGKPTPEKLPLAEELNRSSTTGAKLQSFSTNCGSYDEGASKVTLEVRKDIELRGFSLNSDGCGKVRITLSGNGMNESVTQKLAGGPRSISLSHLNWRLEGGKSYSLTVTPVADTAVCGSDKSPSLANATGCTAAGRTTAELALSYSGHQVIYDFRYYY